MRCEISSLYFLSRLAGCLFAAFFTLGASCAATWSPKEFDFAVDTPDQDALFPQPPSVLVDETNEQLSVVVEYGEYDEHVAKRSADNWAKWSSRRSTFEGARDLAIVQSAAGKADEALQLMDEAAQLAGQNFEPLREIDLLRSLAALRARDPAGASTYAERACAPPILAPLNSLCVHLLAIAASTSADRNRAALRMRILRDASLPEPLKALPREPRWDALRAAYFDVLRFLYKQVATTRDQDQAAANITASFLRGFTNSLRGSGATSDEAWNAFRQLLGLESLHDNFERALFWLELFRRQVIVRFENGPEDISERKLYVEEHLASMYLRTGNLAEADASVRSARELIGRTVDPVMQHALLFYFANLLDVPGSGDYAIRHFAEVWTWAAEFRRARGEDPPPRKRSFSERFGTLGSVTGGNAFDLNAEPKPSDEERPEILQYAAGLRLTVLYLAAGDLRRFDQYRGETRELALVLDRRIGERPLHLCLLDIVTGDAIRRFSNDQPRLEQAREMLADVKRQIETKLTFPGGDPFALRAAWMALADKIERKGGSYSYNTSMPIGRRLTTRLYAALGRVYAAQGQWDESQRTLDEALIASVVENTVGGLPLEQATLNVDIARVAENRGDFDRVKVAAHEALLSLALANGKSLDFAAALATQSSFFLSNGDYYGAELGLRRAIAIHEGLGKENDRKLAEYRGMLAGVYLTEKDPEAAVHLAGQAVETIARYAREQWTRSEVQAMDIVLRAGYEWHAGSPDVARAALSSRFFETAQRRTMNQAGVALDAVMRRAALTDPGLRALVQEREEFDRQRYVLDQQFEEAFATSSAAENTATRDRVNAEIIRLDAEIAARNRAIDPRLLALSAPAPVAVDEVKRRLNDDEALVLFVATSAEVFVWAVTKSQNPRWARVQGGIDELSRRIQALRCGLDEEQWRAASRADRCARLLGLSEFPAKSRPLPFRLDLAHELYVALFGPIEDLIKDKQILVVPSGPLTSLPFNVLVTATPETALPTGFDGYRNVAWLGRAQAITVLPAVASLRALGAVGRAPDDYIGYGDPLLTGDAAVCRHAQLPTRCPAVASASAAGPVVVAASGDGRATVGGRGGRGSADLDQVYARQAASRAVVERVRSLCPLPDTAYEISCVAERFSENSRLIRLGAAATKSDIKKLSVDGALARYRIVHFATHGLLAGDVAALARTQGEPALVMTPPDRPQDADDNGLLTASEIAQLKLNADWVVLSACNTAAGDGLGAEALSGLARAFFFAQARALLVSHWPVYSDAAVRLTTSAFAELDRNPRAERAEALRSAMIELMDDDRPDSENAHPSVWAPFVVVGEGAR
jgi:CHAT domain-containing protein/tetratricopeptide (TPR) repeat protein